MAAFSREDLCPNKYTKTLVSATSEKLYSKNSRLVPSQLLTRRDLQRSQDYYALENKLSHCQISEQLEKSLARDQPETLKPGNWLRRTQAERPSETSFLTKESGRRSPGIKREQKERASTVPQITVLPPVDPPTCSRPPQNAGFKTLLRLPKIFCKFKSGLNNEAKNVKIEVKRKIITKTNNHCMIRQPLAPKKDQLKSLSEQGKVYIAASGPPIELGEDRTGWMREYFTPDTKRADFIYSSGYPLSMKYFKRDFLLLHLRGEGIQQEKDAWFAWEAHNKKMYNISVFKTFKMRELWNDDENLGISKTGLMSLKKPIQISLEQLLIPIGERPFGQLGSENKETILLTALTNVIAVRLKHLLDDEFAIDVRYTEDEWLKLCLNFAAQDISNIIQALREIR